MLERYDSPEKHRILALAVAVFFLYLYSMFYQVNYYLFNSLYGSYYSFFVPILVAGVLYFRRFRDGTEFKLLTLYWLWFVLSRILNNDPALTEDYLLLFTLSPMLPMFVLGLVLDSEGRRRFLAWLSVVAGLFYFALGLLAQAAFVLNRLFINPITQGYLGPVPDQGTYFLSILDSNPNAGAYWFMTGLLLMVYQFFACRRKLWRVPIVLCALVCYVSVAITYCRSVRVSIAVVLALLAVLLCARAVKRGHKVLRVLLLVLLFLLAFAAINKSFDLITDGMSSLRSAVAREESVDTAPAPHSQDWKNTGGQRRPVVYQAMSDSPLYQKLNKLSTYRLEIYACALRSIQEDPLILLRGCLKKDSMTVTDAILQRPSGVPNFHNSLLQVLILTGLPGFCLALAFCLLLLVKGFRLFFSALPEVGLAERTLFLCLLAPMVYGVFEAFLFTDTDVRALFFFLLSGMAMGEYYKAYPAAR